ncbi:hypothetical protein HN681_03615 [archaeon]|jgi:hypothetical protein|nr:hypothetical protein [archaeon]MBT3730395.1 hypothetical protein [archaeon]MBT4670378.1 hypothetical protein [archaeon]MBT5030157.1 hypothetical protein [archaeon]MBT5287724.1 hypothetical protein [archaeon]
MTSRIIFYGKQIGKIVDALEHIADYVETWDTITQDPFGGVEFCGCAEIPEGREREATRALRKEESNGLTYLVEFGSMKRPSHAYI